MCGGVALARAAVEDDERDERRAGDEESERRSTIQCVGPELPREERHEQYDADQRQPRGGQATHQPVLARLDRRGGDRLASIEGSRVDRQSVRCYCPRRGYRALRQYA
jgi:hypothetical protein